MCSSWLLRSDGRMFYSSGCLKGFAIINYSSLKARLLEIFLALRVYLGLGLSWIRGELLKLFIANYLYIALNRITKYYLGTTLPPLGISQ
jgi:hypothetical protein